VRISLRFKLPLTRLRNGELLQPKSRNDGICHANNQAIAEIVITRGDSTSVGCGLDSSTAICAVYRVPREVCSIGSTVRRRVSQISATTVFRRQTIRI